LSLRTFKEQTVLRWKSSGSGVCGVGTDQRLRDKRINGKRGKKGRNGRRASQSIPASGRGDPSQRLINLWLKPLAGGMAEWGKQSLVFSLQCCSDKIKLQ
jgi:hypothetical protein